MYQIFELNVLLPWNIKAHNAKHLKLMLAAAFQSLTW